MPPAIVWGRFTLATGLDGPKLTIRQKFVERAERRKLIGNGGICGPGSFQIIPIGDQMPLRNAGKALPASQSPS